MGARINLKPLMGRIMAAIGAFALFLFALMAISGGAQAKEYANVVDLRMGTNQGITRVVLEADKDLPYALFLLSDPGRLVIDLPELNWAEKPTARSLDIGVMAGYRVGLFKPGVTRLVVDLNRDIEVTNHFILPAKGETGPRLVVDMRPSANGNQLPKGQKLGEIIQSSTWADYQASLAKTPTAQLPLIANSRQKPLIVIDPGHGGIDPGAISTSGKYEKHIVLAIAKRVAELMRATGRYEVALTRERDIFIPLRQRYEFAHKLEADLFISLHADSHGNNRLRGASFYTLSDKASDKEAAALARKENKSDLLAGTNLDQFTSDVSSILIDLAQKSVAQSSWHMGEMLVENLSGKVRLLPRPHRFAGFAVLKSPNIPSVLIELGYLSNKQDEKNLRSKSYIDNLANGIIKAVDGFMQRQQRLANTGT